MTPKIIWHKWSDPMASLVMNAKKDSGNHQEMYDDDDEDPHLQSFQDSMYGENDVKWDRDNEETRKIGPCIVGPNGIIPITEGNIPSKLYNFWIGHTNVDLGVNKRGDAIASVDGVETIDFFTRYRFRVAIGKAFSQEEVKKNMEKALMSGENVEVVRQKAVGVARATTPNDTSPANSDTMFFVKTKLSEKYKFWSISITQNNEVRFDGGDTREEVEANTAKRIGTKEVIWSWKEKEGQTREGS